MSNAFSLEEQTFESYSEFDPENFELELTESEWEEEIRRGLPSPPRGTTAYRQSERPQRSMQNRPWPPKHPVRGYSPPQQPLFVDLRIDGEPASRTCPVHGTDFVRWVQSSLNEVLGLRLPVTGIMNTATRSAGFSNSKDSQPTESPDRRPSARWSKRRKREGNRRETKPTWLNMRN
jgi:hypothetical protein